MMQNISTRYNILYNARLLLQDAEENRRAQYPDHYQQVLSVFQEPTEVSIQASGQLMDSLIGKCNRIIHEKTASKYPDQAHFLIGRANYEKGNYFNAAEFFTYVSRVYADKPRTRQAALAWKARSLIQIDRLSEAADVLDTAFANLESEKRSVALLFATQAAFYLRTGDTETTIDMLRQAITHSNDKADRLRWHFLAGQLLDRHERYDEAYTHFRKVARSNVSYEMAFHAQLNLAVLQNRIDPSVEGMVYLLKRMLRDDKNKEFKDQIYHRIADIYREAGDTEAGTAYYQLALQQESTNNFQRSMSYLQLADLFFEQGLYEQAKQYYDSTAAVIPRDHADYGLLMRKVTHLDTLVSHLRMVAREDSLQWLAGLSEERRLAIIDSIAAGALAQRQAARQMETSLRESAQAAPMYIDNTTLMQQNTYTDSRFYFNNPDAISRGLSEFRRRWGNRQLADNWRISDKSNQLTMAERNQTAGADTNTTDANDDALVASQVREYYLQHLPLDPEQRAVSDERIIAALLATGNIYRDDLGDRTKAAEAYLELLKRYPANKQLSLLYYNLYRIYTETNAPQAAIYKDKLLTEFPDSRYSHLIRDPEYLRKMDAQVQAFRSVYNSMYELYTDKQYSELISRAGQILPGSSEHAAIAAQIAYLQALAIGRTDSLPAFEEALKQIVEIYPADSLIHPLVSQHLTYIADNRDSLMERTTALYDMDGSRPRFVDEPTLTLWPQLVIRQTPAAPRPRRQLQPGSTQSTVRQRDTRISDAAPEIQDIATGRPEQIRHENSYRDTELLPDTAVYYFVINVMNARVNLAPSRYGIGQFNRTQYAGLPLSHQLKTVDQENQLVYVGIFNTYQDAKMYESRIKPLLHTIMKIPGDLYHTFIITAGNLENLTDYDKIDEYHRVYSEQQ